MPIGAPTLVRLENSSPTMPARESTLSVIGSMTSNEPGSPTSTEHTTRAEASSVARIATCCRPMKSNALGAICVAMARPMLAASAVTPVADCNASSPT